MQSESKGKAADIYAAWRERELGGQPACGDNWPDATTRTQRHEAEKENTPEQPSYAPVAIKSTIQRRFKTFRRRSQGVPMADMMTEQPGGLSRQSTGTQSIRAAVMHKIEI